MVGGGYGVEGGEALDECRGAEVWGGGIAPLFDVVRFEVGVEGVEGTAVFFAEGAVVAVDNPLPWQCFVVVFLYLSATILVGDKCLPGVPGDGQAGDG